MGIVGGVVVLAPSALVHQVGDLTFGLKLGAGFLTAPPYSPEARVCTMSATSMEAIMHRQVDMPPV